VHQENWRAAMAISFHVHGPWANWDAKQIGVDGSLPRGRGYPIRELCQSAVRWTMGGRLDRLTGYTDEPRVVALG
jgi:hypothetical protein